MTKINQKELADFLEEANKSTYANKDAPKAPSSRPGSDDYHFEKGSLIYHDTYFGSRDFIGEEVVYKNTEPVWGMNYYGFILDNSIDEKDLYGFLRIALMQEYKNIIPVRGPKNFSKNDWSYQNRADGKLDRFAGIEEILKSGEVIYRAHYHGGFIN